MGHRIRARPVQAAHDLPHRRPWPRERALDVRRRRRRYRADLLPNQTAGGRSEHARRRGVATFITDARVVVKSQDTKHPFYVGLHMTGGAYGGGSPQPNTTLG